MPTLPYPSPVYAIPCSTQPYLRGSDSSNREERVGVCLSPILFLIGPPPTVGIAASNPVASVVVSVSRSFCPRPTNAARAILIVSLLLLAGDVELNPGPLTHVNIPDWINIGCLNCFSASGKVALIHNIIADYELDFLALSETWFTTDTPVSTMNDIALAPGYSSLHVPRPMVNGGASRGGGLSVVFRDSVVVRRHPLADKFCPSTFELQLIRVGLPPSTVHAVFNIYRPQRIPQRSTSVAAFVDELGDVITSFAASCADNIVIIGDLNAPGADGSHIDDELATLFESFGMTQFVNSPTRGDNLLDVIASVDPSAIKGVSVNDGGRLSDHQLIVAKLASHRSKQNVRYQCRNLKAVDPISFERELRNSSLFSCPESTVDGFTEQLQRVVITVLDALAPVRCRLRRPPNPTSKWLSTEAVAAKRERRRLVRRWLSSRNESDRQRYRRACRSANKVINDSRKNHFRRKLQDCRDDPRRRWNVVKELLHSSSSDNSRTDAENRELCHSFCHFFPPKCSVLNYLSLLN